MAPLPPPLSAIFHSSRRCRRRRAILALHEGIGRRSLARSPSPAGLTATLYPWKNERGRARERERERCSSVCQCRPPPRPTSEFPSVSPSPSPARPPARSPCVSRLLLIARHQLHLASIRPSPPPASLSQRRREALPRRRRRRQRRRRRSNSPFSVLVDTFGVAGEGERAPLLTW